MSKCDKPDRSDFVSQEMGHHETSKKSLLFWGYTVASLIFVPQLSDGFTGIKWIAFGFLSLGLLWQHKSQLQLSPWNGLFLWPLLCMNWKDDAFSELVIWLVIATATLLPPLTTDMRQSLRKAIALSAYFVSTYLLLQKAGFDPLNWFKDPPPGSFFGNPNFAGHFLLLAICLGSFPRSNYRWLAYLLLGTAMTITQSRGVYLGLSICIIIRCLQKTSHRMGVLLILSLFLSVPMIHFMREQAPAQNYLFSPKNWTQEFLDQPDEADDREPWFQGKRKSLMTRLLLWQNTTEVVVQNPMGVGMGMYAPHYWRVAVGKDVNLSHHYRPDFAHNVILDIAARYGIIFSIICIMSCITVFRRAKQPWSLAFAIQALIALFSLNYLNPAIAFALLLLRPEPSQPRIVNIKPHALSLPLLILFLFTALLSYFQYAPKNCPVLLRNSLFPEHSARLAYETKNYDTAWFHQWEALRRDPANSHLQYNFALIELAHKGPSDLTLYLLYHITESNPFYRPAGTTLSELKSVYPDLPDGQSCTKSVQTQYPDIFTTLQKN